MNASEFRKEIEQAINRNSMESGSNTPDFILAEYLSDCLMAFDKAVKRRSKWYGDGAITPGPVPATPNDLSTEGSSAVDHSVRR